MSPGAHLIGIKPQALPAWLALSAALSAMEDDGRHPICASRPDQWSADATPTARQDAAEACGYCPARGACLEFGRRNTERAGVWGGVDFTNPTARKENAA